MDLIISILVIVAVIVIMVLVFGFCLAMGSLAAGLVSRIMGYPPTDADRDL